jgi:hypothetical protein
MNKTNEKELSNKKSNKKSNTLSLKTRSRSAEFKNGSISGYSKKSLQKDNAISTLDIEQSLSNVKNYKNKKSNTNVYQTNVLFDHSDVLNTKNIQPNEVINKFPMPISILNSKK